MSSRLVLLEELWAQAPDRTSCGGVARQRIWMQPSFGQVVRKRAGARVAKRRGARVSDFREASNTLVASDAVELSVADLEGKVASLRKGMRALAPPLPRGAQPITRVAWLKKSGIEPFDLKRFALQFPSIPNVHACGAIQIFQVRRACAVQEHASRGPTLRNTNPTVRFWNLAERTGGHRRQCPLHG